MPLKKGEGSTNKRAPSRDNQVETQQQTLPTNDTQLIKNKNSTTVGLNQSKLSM